MYKEFCHHCGSKETKCVSQYSDDNGKIITTWRCRQCGKKFETKW